MLDYARMSWPELTGDDFSTIGSDRNRLIAAVQARYGISKNTVERELLWCDGV